MEEIKLNMENLSTDEREQLLKLVEKANKQNSTWKPNLGEAYYVIDDCSAIYRSVVGRTHDESIDEGRYSIGNCFRTKEEAEFAVERQKVIVELERYALEHRDPTKEPTWELMFDRYCKKIFGIDSTDVFVSNIRFTSGKIAEKAIKTIGEDRIKKYYFGVIE